MTKVGVVSLGCDKNRVDSEIMLYNLQKGGFEITGDPSDADIIIVNTCAFIESARQESIDTVLEMSRYKKGKCKKLIMTGCLPQRFISEMFDEFTEVDGFLGTNDYPDIVPFIKGLDKRCYKVSPNTARVEEGERIVTTPGHYAYLRVADGCDNFCTYCLIPSIRGKYRSRQMEHIVDEAEALVAGGAKELILIAQDLTKYGVDLYGERKLVALIKRLSQIEGLVWIRLLYCYPELIDDALIEEIATNDKVAKYIDIPLQHSNDNVLKRMGRRSTKKDLLRLFDKLRAKIPDIAVRTTFILGFPGESQADFEYLCDFVTTQKLSNVGFFTYSREDGTAAAKMKDQIAEEVKKQRLEKLADLQYEIVCQNNKHAVGKQMTVVIDDIISRSGEKYIYKARSQYNAPDIDGCVYVTSDKMLNTGDFVNVVINGYADYDLKGEAL